ncbi:MAG: molybdenum cofactor guanylyltransferase MobA [gamma proteobacterium symbiont of Taylorina sp.]|nr:molybdenum cofactor guanylyltransferase MobA [gamma proteobacterium symbiont of Taylorina sp.]
MQITGLILAGGRSSRMEGHDKGLLTLVDKSMIEHVIEKLKPQVDQILISANRHIEQYQSFGYEVLLDEYDDFRGPLAGMVRGLSHSNSEYLLTVPCDGPLLPIDLAVKLLDSAQKKSTKAVFVFDGKYKQPTYNLLHSDLLKSIEQSLEHQEHKLGKWLLDNGACAVDFSAQKNAFLNVNTPKDLQLLAEALQ